MQNEFNKPETMLQIFLSKLDFQKNYLILTGLFKYEPEFDLWESCKD